MRMTRVYVLGETGCQKKKTRERLPHILHLRMTSMDVANDFYEYCDCAEPHVRPMACAVQVKPLKSHLDPEFAIKRKYRAGF